MATLEIRGSGDRSFVFIHGSPSNRHVYDRLAARAPEGTAVVLVDLPDHGDAPDELTASLGPLEEAVLEAVGAAPGDVTVVGHSMGAWLVAATAARMPDRVRHLVAVAGLSHYSDEQLAMRHSMVGQLERGELDPAGLGEVLLGMMLGEERSPALVAEVSPMLDLSRERWIRIARRSFAINAGPPAYLGRAGTVVHGTGDQAIPLERGLELARGSGVELISIETTSHMLPMTHPDRLAAIIYGRS